jgi:hypothetical protein
MIICLVVSSYAFSSDKVLEKEIMKRHAREKKKFYQKNEQERDEFYDVKHTRLEGFEFRESHIKDRENMELRHTQELCEKLNFANGACLIKEKEEEEIDQ